MKEKTVSTENLDHMVERLTQGEILALAKAAMRAHAYRKANYYGDNRLEDMMHDALENVVPQSIDWEKAKYVDSAERGDLAEDICEANYWRTLIGEREMDEQDEEGWLRIYG